MYEAVDETLLGSVSLACCWLGRVGVLSAGIWHGCLSLQGWKGKRERGMGHGMCEKYEVRIRRLLV